MKKLCAKQPTSRMKLQDVLSHAFIQVQNVPGLFSPRKFRLASTVEVHMRPACIISPYFRSSFGIKSANGEPVAKR